MVAYPINKHYLIEIQNIITKNNAYTNRTLNVEHIEIRYIYSVQISYLKTLLDKDIFGFQRQLEFTYNRAGK